jgi:hypothetical protein
MKAPSLLAYYIAGYNQGEVRRAAHRSHSLLVALVVAILIGGVVSIPWVIAAFRS